MAPSTPAVPALPELPELPELNEWKSSGPPTTARAARARSGILTTPHLRHHQLPPPPEQEFAMTYPNTPRSYPS